MATLAERIQNIVDSTRVNHVDKINRIRKMGLEHPSVRENAIHALADLTNADRAEFGHAAEAVFKIATKFPHASFAAIDALAQISNNRPRRLHATEQASAEGRHIVTIANSCETENIAVKAAKTIAGMDIPSDATLINTIETHESDARAILPILEKIANADSDDSKYGDVNEHHFMACSAISHLARTERHPELTNAVYDSLSRVGTNLAAQSAASLMIDHYTHKVRPHIDGKKGNRPHGGLDRPPFNERGFAALTTIGERGVRALYVLANNHDEAVTSSIDALSQIGTPFALKTIARIGVEKPDYEPRALNSLRDIETAQAADALVDFGSAVRFGASEAYSTRANAAFAAIKDIYARGLRKPDWPKGEKAKVQKAATELAAAITSESSLKRRFAFGGQYMGGLPHDTSRAIGLETTPFNEAENKRNPDKKLMSRSYIKGNVQGLRELFTHAEKIGLLSTDDRSLKKLNAFAKYEKQERKSRKAARTMSPKYRTFG